MRSMRSVRMRAKERFISSMPCVRPRVARPRASVRPTGRARVLDALVRLPEEHRVVLSLFAVEGLDQAQIADIVGVPPGTVWYRLHNARTCLGAMMDRIE